MSDTEVTSQELPRRKRSLYSRVYFFIDYNLKRAQEFGDTAYTAGFVFIGSVLAVLVRYLSETLGFLMTPNRGVVNFPLNALKYILAAVIVVSVSVLSFAAVLVIGGVATILGFRNIADYSVKEQVAAFILIFALVVAIPFLVPQYTIFKVSLCFAFAIGVVGMDFLYGQCGILSLGHAGFVLLSGYFTTWLSIGTFGFQLPILISVFVAALIVSVIGILLGAPSLRIKDYYLVIVTMAFTMTIPKLMKSPYLAVVSGAREGGINVSSLVIPESLKFLSLYQLNYFSIVLPALVLFFIAYNINHKSQIGRAFKTIKCDNEISLIMGIPVLRYKLFAFALNAFYAGVCGGFLTVLTKFIHPDSYTLSDSIQYVVAAVVGGPTSLLGGIIGGGFLAYEPDFTQAIANLIPNGKNLARGFYGLLLVIIVLFSPKGIAGQFTSWIKAKFHKMTRRGAYYVDAPPDYEFLKDKAVKAEIEKWNQ